MVYTNCFSMLFLSIHTILSSINRQMIDKNRQVIMIKKKLRSCVIFDPMMLPRPYVYSWSIIPSCESRVIYSCSDIIFLGIDYSFFSICLLIMKNAINRKARVMTIKAYKKRNTVHAVFVKEIPTVILSQIGPFSMK